VAAVLIGLIGWRFVTDARAAASSSKASKARLRAAAAVEVATAAPRTIYNTEQGVGSLQAPYKVEVSPKTAGIIDYLDLREGDPVKKGQRVLEVSPSDLEGAVTQARQNVADAENKFAQAEEGTNYNKVGVESQIAQQKAAQRSAQADLDQTINSSASSIHQAQAIVDAAQSGVTNAEAALSEAQATLTDAKAKFDRTNYLYKHGFVAAQDVDDAKTAVDVAQGAVGVQQAMVKSAQSQLKSQEDNLSIVKQKAGSDIADAKAKRDQADQILRTALANRPQIQAYKDQLNALRAEEDAAKAALAQAEARLHDTVTTSSIDGTVTARKADPGALAAPGTPVLEIQFIDWLFDNATFPIEVRNLIHEGQQATITIDSIPGKTFTGKVVNVNDSGDPQSRSFDVNVRLDNKDHSLHPGMYGQISIITGRTDALVTVPREAVTTATDGSQTATVVDSTNTAHIHPVTLGVSDAKGYQVLSGVSAGDRVVVLTYTPVKDGGKVSIGKPGGNGAGSTGRGQGGRRRQPQ